MWLLLLAGEQRPCPRLGGPERGAHGGTLAEPWDVRSRATAAAEVGPKVPCARAVGGGSSGPAAILPPGSLRGPADAEQGRRDPCRSPLGGVSAVVTSEGRKLRAWDRTERAPSSAQLPGLALSDAPASSPAT